ncbi:hypothetical protein [Glycomyces tenuis]|uniref:hypothetical protein n=1 Tax=Glycomyces tenuis TaxID=58116 RepID=UPI0003FE1FB3|nr:hypothetical protein [Glycomyces tenuis]
MTTEDLDRLRHNAEKYQTSRTPSDLLWLSIAGDFAALVAEVDRLRARNADLFRRLGGHMDDLGDMTTERDRLRADLAESDELLASAERDREQYRIERDALAAKLTAFRALPPEPRCDHEGDCSVWSHGWDSGRNATLREVGRVLDGQLPLRDYSETPRPPVQERVSGPEAPEGSTDRGTPVPESLRSNQVSDSHWLKFNADCQVTGCQCGFRADLDSDCEFGDSVVAHLLDVGHIAQADALKAAIRKEHQEPEWVAYEKPCDDCKTADQEGHADER